MAIKALCIGKTSESYLKDGMEIFTKRIGKYASFQWIELSDVKKNKFSSSDELKKLEAEILLKEIAPRDFVIGLDEKGESYSSRDFAASLNQFSVENANVVFIIGGAFGYDEQVYQRMNKKISLSKMTFSHQLVRLLFLEQLYRAYSILKGDPYHND